jgi:hypothetical protein
MAQAHARAYELVKVTRAPAVLAGDRPHLCFVRSEGKCVNAPDGVLEEKPSARSIGRGQFAR